MYFVRIVLSIAMFPFFQPLCVAQKIVTVKLYGHLAVNNGVTIPIFEENTNQVVSFRWPAVAINYLDKNRRYNEWELTNLLIQRSPDSETDTRFSIGGRFEHGIRLSKRENAALAISAGGSIRAFYALEQLNANNILGLAAENEFFGLSLAFTPHLEYRITKNLVFDFSPYLEIANGTARLEYVYDEFIDEDQRGSIDFYFQGFQTLFRFGLGWKF